METRDNLKNEVKSFFENELGFELKENMLFFENIGIDGYDASILMNKFGKRFDVDMNKFDESKYFSDERSLMNFPKRIFNFWVKGTESYTFNLEHCVNVVEKKKWYDMNN